MLMVTVLAVHLGAAHVSPQISALHASKDTIQWGMAVDRVHKDARVVHLSQE